jgi:hypothetical protein
MTAALRTSTAVYFLLASTLSAACLVGFTFVLPQLPALQRLRLSPTAAAAVGGGGPVNVKAVQLSAVHRPQQDDLAGSCVDDEEALSDEEQGGGGSGEAGAGVPLLGKHDDAGIAASGASRGGGVIPISATSASSLRLPRGANATAGVPAGSYTAAAGHNRSAKGQPATGAWGQGAGLLRPAPRSGAGAGVREYEDDIEDEMLTLVGHTICIVLENLVQSADLATSPHLLKLMVCRRVGAQLFPMKGLWVECCMHTRLV